MSRQLLPLARTTDLNIESIGSETLIFDRTTDKAYVLSPSAASVWRASNGTRTVQEIATYLSQDSPTDEQTVWYALGQMQELLEASVELPQTMRGISRRQFLKRAGLIASAAAVPVVVSIVAPQPAHAQSVTGVTCCTYFCAVPPNDICVGPTDPCPVRDGCTFSSAFPAPDCGSCAGG